MGTIESMIGTPRSPHDTEALPLSGLEAARPAAPTVEYVVALHLSHAAAVDLERVPALLGDPEAPWLGERVSEDGTFVRRFLCDLELHAGVSQRALFRKSAIVGFGALVRDPAGWVVPIEWRAATLAPLFPVFAGRLMIRPDRIELEGRYAPPGGKLGQMVDRALLGAAARGTARWFLGKLASQLS